MLMDSTLTFRLTGVANRLNRSASAFYSRRYGVGVQEWRLLLVLGRGGKMTVGDAANAADIDTAAASRALKTLNDRKLVSLEMTRSRGRATIARLTDTGQALFAQLREASAERASQISDGLNPEEIQQINAQLTRILTNIETMNANYATKEKEGN